MRRVALLSAGLGLAVLLLPACGPADRRGISLTDDGVPVVEDCGAYVTRVEAADAAAHRTIWAAHIPHDVWWEHGGAAGIVELGRLPSRDWVEDRPLALAPRPATWVFTIETENEVHEVIRVADEDLAPGRVYLPGHGSVSRGQFFDGASFNTGTCVGPELIAARVAGVAIVIGVAIGIASAVGDGLLRRQAARVGPPGAAPADPA